MSTKRNHEPDQQGIWFDYTGFRYKDMYDVRLHDGTVIENLRPNGNSWYGRARPIRDDEVAQVRLKPDGEINDGYHAIGQERIDHQIYLFGKKPEESPS